jgi:SAM-dependent methyltransferase
MARLSRAEGVLAGVVERGGIAPRVCRESVVSDQLSRLEKLERHAAALEAALAATYSSTSWRITAPLRRMRALFGGEGDPTSPAAPPAQVSPMEAPAPEPEAAPAGPSRSVGELKSPYVAHVEEMKARLPHEQAMQQAIGGDFERVGRVEAAQLAHYGLPADGYLIDVGCGSGRLAKPLSAHLKDYLGVDLVPDLVAHARKIANRPEWRFQVIDHIEIPEADGAADMVCFFSVMTHLLHEQTYWYLEECRRVLKPGGKVVFSFLEYGEPWHWATFMQTLEGEKRGTNTHLNVCIDRAAIPIWAEHLGFAVEDIRGAREEIVPEGHLGQSLCVLRKPG